MKRCIYFIIISLTFVILSSTYAMPGSKNMMYRDAKIYGLNNMGPDNSVAFFAINSNGNKMAFWTRCPNLHHTCARLLESACQVHNSPYRFKIFYDSTIFRRYKGRTYYFAYGLEYRGEQYNIKNGQNID